MCEWIEFAWIRKGFTQINILQCYHKTARYNNIILKQGYFFVVDVS